jgi:hypothetical protein
MARSAGSTAEEQKSRDQERPRPHRLAAGAAAEAAAFFAIVSAIYARVAA